MNFCILIIIINLLLMWIVIKGGRVSGMEPLEKEKDDLRESKEEHIPIDEDKGDTPEIEKT